MDISVIDLLQLILVFATCLGVLFFHAFLTRVRFHLLTRRLRDIFGADDKPCEQGQRKWDGRTEHGRG